MSKVDTFLADLDHIKNRVRTSLVSLVKEKKAITRDEYVYDMMTRNVMEYFGAESGGVTAGGSAL